MKMRKLGESMMKVMIVSSCEWGSLSQGALETRVHYKSGRENRILVDNVRGRYDNKWRTSDMFALGSVARGDGWVRVSMS
jgi:hypothetical protein